jgi:ornithine cyclodeaminase/alanine dehydrogenase-like protein (mu-crystallin family)
MILLSERAAESIVTTELAIESAVEAFSSFSAREANVPLRGEIHRFNPSGIALVMPGLVGNTLGLKFGSSIEAASAPGGRHTTVFLIIWDAATLRPRGVISADVLNNHRTAAGFAAASRVLARSDSTTHVLFGAGKTAFASALYISAVRPIRRLIICSRTGLRVEALADRIRRHHGFGDLEVITDMAADDAAAHADIITTVTRSEQPVFDGRVLRNGTHINLGGANKRHQREMDDAAARHADFWLDSEDSCRARSGDLMFPLEAGVIAPKQIQGEIGEVLLGRKPGRETVEQITVFKSMGIATQDLVLGARLLDVAESRGVGLTFDHLDDMSGF